jgi:hypothetical protein
MELKADALTGGTFGEARPAMSPASPQTAELVAAVVAAGTAVVVIREQIHAATVAVGLTRRALTSAGNALLPSATGTTATTTMVGVARKIDATAVARAEPAFAATKAADATLPSSTGLAADPTIESVAAHVHAGPATAGASVGAAALACFANLTGPALDAAPAAVVGVAEHADAALTAAHGIDRTLADAQGARLPRAASVAASTAMEGIVVQVDAAQPARRERRFTHLHAAARLTVRLALGTHVAALAAVVGVALERTAHTIARHGAPGTLAAAIDADATASAGSIAAAAMARIAVERDALGVAHGFSRHHAHAGAVSAALTFAAGVEAAATVRRISLEIDAGARATSSIRRTRPAATGAAASAVRTAADAADAVARVPAWPRLAGPDELTARAPRTDQQQGNDTAEPCQSTVRMAAEPGPARRWRGHFAHANVQPTPERRDRSRGPDETMKYPGWTVTRHVDLALSAAPM